MKFLFIDLQLMINFHSQLLVCTFNKFCYFQKAQKNRKVFSALAKQLKMPNKADVLSDFARAFRNLSTEDTPHNLLFNNKNDNEFFPSVSNSVQVPVSQHKTSINCPANFQEELHAAREFNLAQNKHTKLIFPNLRPTRTRRRPKKFSSDQWITSFNSTNYVTKMQTNNFQIPPLKTFRKKFALFLR